MRMYGFHKREKNVPFFSRYEREKAATGKKSDCSRNKRRLVHLCSAEYAEKNACLVNHHDGLGELSFQNRDIEIQN